ncbi:MAG: hypothetical protein ACR2QJ_01690 [Geminicoccaceae bacterium]
MNITPSQNTLQAFGASVSPSAPAAHVRQAAAAEPIERPAANVTQRVDAAPRAESPARPDADSRPPAQTASQADRPGSRLNLLV